MPPSVEHKQAAVESGREDPIVHEIGVDAASCIKCFSRLDLDEALRSGRC
jgi:hypothetical protein